MKKTDLDEAKKLWESLKEDVTEIITTTSHDLTVLFNKLHEDPENQSWRRIYVRTAYAWIEATVYSMKLTALLFNNPKNEKLKLTIGENAIIFEKSFYLTDTGLVKSRQNFQETAKSLRFAFRVNAKVFNVDFHLDINCKGWQSYLDGLKIRNRITHPKSKKDLYVTDKDQIIVSDAVTWFSENIERLTFMSLGKNGKLPTLIH